MPESDSATIEGYIENLSAQRVTGWAWEVGSDRALVLQVLLRERVLGEAVADRFRKDLLDGKKGNGKHAFEYVFPAPLTDFARPGHVRVRVRGTQRLLAPLESLVKRLATLAPAPQAPPPPPAPQQRAATATPPAAPPIPRPQPPEPIPAIAPEALPADLLPPAPIPPPPRPPVEQPAKSAEPPPPAPDQPAKPIALPRPAAPPPTLIVTATHDHRLNPRAVWLAALRTQAPGAAAPTILAFGGQARPPLTTQGVDLHHVPGNDLASVVAGAIAAAGSHPGAAVIVSPASFDALVAGALIARLHGSKLIVDIADADIPLAPAATLDDRELAPALAGPPEALATFLPALIAEADAVLVANPVLRRRTGGMVVRQGRDQAVFDPAGYARRQLRAAFGYAETDRIVLLQGSLTQQDGVLEIADALERIADPHLALCLVGAIADPKIQQRLAACTRARIAVQAPPPATRVPALIAMADCVAVLQSATQPETQWRVPARLIDALAMDVPVIATPAPPLQDLAAAGALQLVADAAQLDAALRAVAAAPSPTGRRHGAHAIYLAEFSAQVNAARLALALDEAAAAPAADKPNTTALFRALQTHLRAKLPFMVPENPAAAPATVAPPFTGRAPLPRAARPRDLVFLAAGNESGLFGLRGDQIAEHLLSTGKVGRILHFDARLSVAELERLAAGQDGEAHRASLIYANTVRRVLGLADTPNFLRRTFLHRSGRKAERMMGRDLPPAADYLDFIRRILRENDFEQAPLLWVSGNVPEVAAISQAVEPALLIADLPFPDPAGSPPDDSLSALLKEADLLFAADTGVHDRFSSLRPGIQILPGPAKDAPADEAAAWWNQQLTRVWPSIERDA
jgi:glycosyltransferase involved in cell wall biosynthesis